MSKGNILVTGGTGYIGSHTIIDLIEEGYTPISVDNGMNSSIKSLDQIYSITGKNVKHYNLDICQLDDLKKIFQDQKIDGIIHFAALKAVGESTEKPILYFKNNLISLLNILECMRDYDVKNLIYSSSCTVYGNVEKSPVSENTPLQEAESPYGRTKQMGEHIIEDSIKVMNSKAILLRYFNPAGAHLSGKIGESPIVLALNLIPAITETAKGRRGQMTVFGNDYETRDGSCVRDYIHVVDLARAHTLAMQRLLANKQTRKVDIYNLGMGQGVTVLEAIEAFEKVSGEKLNYVIGDRRPGDVVAIYADPQKAIDELGWQPQLGIEDIMSTAWAWENNRTF